MPVTTRDIVGTIAPLTEVDREWFETQSDYWHYGFQGTSDRVAAVAELAASEFPGDLAEIGCANGRTTVKLAEIAGRYDRKVLAIDPWERDPKDWHEFSQRLLFRYGDVVTPLPVKSQSQAAIMLLDRPLCFAWIDGEHNYDALLSDLRATSHARVIAVDDIAWDGMLLRAFVVGAQGRQPIRHPWCNEGYIL